MGPIRRNLLEGFTKLFAAPPERTFDEKMMVDGIEKFVTHHAMNDTEKLREVAGDHPGIWKFKKAPSGLPYSVMHDIYYMAGDDDTREHELEHVRRGYFHKPNSYDAMGLAPWEIK